MNTETFWILAAVFAPVILIVVQTIRQHGTEDGMKGSYNRYRMEVGRLMNTNHTTTKQRVARVKRQHRKMDEKMVGDFGVARVNEFYQKNNIHELRQRDIETVKKFLP